MMTNSSPANLAAMAPVFPHALFRISATSMSALSPSEWPNLSLMDLKWSMSMMPKCSFPTESFESILDPMIFSNWLRLVICVRGSRVIV